MVARILSDRGGSFRAMESPVCPTCRRPATEALTPEQVSEKLSNLEPIAVAVLEQQLSSLNEGVAQRAAKLLLEWARGKPTQTQVINQDVATTIRYESAAWMPEEELPPSPPISSDPPLLTSGS